MLNKETLERKFEKNGYFIFDDKTGLVNDLRKKIVKKIKSINKKMQKLSDDEVLNQFHKYFSKKEVNGIRLNLYNSINKFSDIDKIYYSISKEVLDNLVGNEIAMQKKMQCN